MKKKTKINIITLGCSKNLVDSEVLMRQLEVNHINFSHESAKDDADVIIINTCGFINDSKQESIDMMLQFVEAKKAKKVKKVFVTGCLAERYKTELEKEIPEIDGFFGVNQLPDLLNTIGVDYQEELTGERYVSTPKHYAYLKISEGCDRTCSFCAIPLIRGKHTSKTIEELTKEAEYLASKGVKELILIAQDITYYGVDIYKKVMLTELVKSLLKIKSLEWIRLHYAYPTKFPDDILKLMNTEPRICKYIDIPLQHVSDKILTSMRRGNTMAQTQDLVNKMRKLVPGIAIRTAFIVGYPGETEKEFKELVQFCKDNKFERLGVFTYSHEENTSAHELKNNVPTKKKQERADKLMKMQEEIALEINQERLGKTLKVIIDRKEGNYFVGRSEWDSPEIDNEILIPLTEKCKIGEFYNVLITKVDTFDLYGVVEKK